MKLLQAMAGAEFGGAEAFFVRLAQALNRAGVDQRVLIRKHPKRAAMLREDGLPVTELPFGGPLDVRTRLAFNSEVDSFKPDIVMTWMSRASAMAPRSRGRFVHVGRLGGYYDLKYYRRCDHLIGNTRDIVGYLVRGGWPEDRAHYLPNFVAGARAEPASRKAHYTPEKAPLVLALGRLHENKGFDILLKAIARVPEAYLWLAGDGPERARLEELAQECGAKPRTRFLGWRDDVAALFAAADLFVCPSRHEPLGNVVIEAWAHGVPVVAADSLGPGTLIEHMRNGVLVPVDDVVSMAEAMKWLLNDPAAAAPAPRAGLASFEAHYTETAVVRQYLDFFQRITESCAASPG